MKSWQMGLALAAAMFATNNARAADPFTLTSPAFKDGDVWPTKYAGPSDRQPNPCYGQNLSPPLAWSNAPAGTKSFALTLQDPDGGLGLGSNHWVAYGIPASKTSLAEGEGSKAPTDWQGGKSAAGTNFYFGPCGPAGQALHHYMINIIATDLEPGALKPDMTREELLAALRGHALGTAGIVGKLTRP